MNHLKLVGRNRERGFTLIEAMVTVGLGGLLALLLFQAFISGQNHYVRHQARIDLQQSVLKGMQGLGSDLRQSSPQSITISSANPNAVSLVRMKTVDSTGKPVWDTSFVIYWLDTGNKRLLRKQWPPLPPASGISYSFGNLTPPRLEDADLKQIALTPNGTERLVGTDVTQFLVQSSGIGSGLYDVTMTCSRKIPKKEKEETFSLTETIPIKNL